jgi:hypothetical protein
VFRLQNYHRSKISSPSWFNRRMRFVILVSCIKIQGVPFKTQPNNNHVLRYKNKLRSRSAPVWNSPRTLESRSSLLLGRSSRQLRKICADANMEYSRAERVFILEHYFASKSFAAVRKAFSNAYPDKGRTEWKIH